MGSGCQGVHLRVKGCEKGGAVRQKRYESIVCCLQMIYDCGGDERGDG